MKEPARQPFTVALWLALGYVGVYLCRDNFSVANPLLQKAFHASKEEVGSIASLGTLGYMLGKFLSGPVTDRIGGRAGYLAALAGVVVFSAFSGFAPGLIALAILYALNRFWGAGGWNAITKLIASWFPPGRFATMLAVVSLSYVFGGIVAPIFASWVLHGDEVLGTGLDWRAVMSVPALPVAILLFFCARFVHRGPLVAAPADEPVPNAECEARSAEGPDDRGQRTEDGGPRAEDSPHRLPSSARNPQSPIRNPEPRSVLADLGALFRKPDFQTLCILSFTLTLLREGLKTWKVDYLLSLQPGAEASAGGVGVAAVQGVAFDAAGALPILLMGITFDRIAPRARRWVVAGILALLAADLALLATVGKGQAILATILLALVGLLLYGPYSILAGVIAVEAGGTALAATAAGVTDGIGYLAAILAGKHLGPILDLGGYPAAFNLMALLTFATALIALRLRFRPPVVTG